MEARCEVTTVNGDTNREMCHLISRFYESVENNVWGAQDN